LLAGRHARALARRHRARVAPLGASEPAARALAPPLPVGGEDARGALLLRPGLRPRLLRALRPCGRSGDSLRRATRLSDLARRARALDRNRAELRLRRPGPPALPATDVVLRSRRLLPRGPLRLLALAGRVDGDRERGRDRLRILVAAGAPGRLSRPDPLPRR